MDSAQIPRLVEPYQVATVAELAVGDLFLIPASMVVAAEVTGIEDGDPAGFRIIFVAAAAAAVLGARYEYVLAGDQVVHRWPAQRSAVGLSPVAKRVRQPRARRRRRSYRPPGHTRH